MSRRIGPETYDEALGKCWRPLLIALAAPTAAVAIIHLFVVILLGGRVPNYQLLWCIMFGAIALPGVGGLWADSRKAAAIFFGMGIVVLAAAITFGTDILLFTGLWVRIMPVSP